jgi:cytochrome b561
MPAARPAGLSSGGWSDRDPLTDAGEALG